MYQGTITKRMKSVRNDIYKAMLTKKDFESKISNLENADSSQYPTICAEICGMFSALGIECEIKKDVSYYKELLLKSNIPDFHDVAESILKTMYTNFHEYPTPEDYMLRMVNRLSNPDDGWQNDTLRIRILKQFIKYGECLRYKNSNGKVYVYCGEAYLKKYIKNKTGKNPKSAEDIIENIDDEVFEVLKSATEAQKKSDGTYGILKLADDLAKGNFKGYGSTKRDLYMFAMVFDMTYSVNSESAPLGTTELLDYESDIEKNLFEDYYVNNLMRFISRVYDSGLCSIELDPSGQGINYKNFAEMVYIYFISKDYDPIVKIERSNEMIERLKSRKSKSKSAAMETKYYESLFTEEILGMNENDFEIFVSENYDCNVEYEAVDKNGNIYPGKKAPLQIQTSQMTAFRIYNEIIATMESYFPDEPSFLKENCNYGLWFVDVSMYKKTGTDSLKEILKKIDGNNKDSEKTEDFINLLYGINMFLGQLFVENGSDLSEEQEHKAPSQRLIKKMSIESPEDITRTALIVAFYYMYNRINEYRGSEKSFIEVMDDYMDCENGLNSFLEEAGYQLVNDRNIFDLAVIFSSYAYMQV